MLDDNNTEGINFNKHNSVAKIQCTVLHDTILAIMTFSPHIWSQTLQLLKYEENKRASFVMLLVKTNHTQDNKAGSADRYFKPISYTFM